MSGFRKFCTVVFFLAFLLSVGSLAADWFSFEPISSVVESCRSQEWFNIILLVLLAISALGVVVVLIGTLAARSKNSYQETSNDLGSVCISKSALQRTVEDVIYAHPELTSLKTSVRIVNRKKPYVDITAKVAPRGLISLATVAPILQKEIKDAVEKLTGNEVRSVVVDIHENKNASDVMTSDEEQQMHRNIDAANNFTPIEPAEAAPVEAESADGVESAQAVSEDSEAVEEAPEGRTEGDSAKAAEDGTQQAPAVAADKE